MKKVTPNFNTSDTRMTRAQHAELMGSEASFFPFINIFEHAALLVKANLAKVIVGDEFRSDSPIETMFISALAVVLLYGQRSFDVVRPDRGSEWTPSADAACKPPFIIYQQVELGEYRVDFLLRFAKDAALSSWRELVVECDGHDYHERTKKQAERDRARDRKLQELGYTVFRFTGSELWRDAPKCAWQVVKYALDFRT